MQGAQILRNEPYIWVRRNDEGCSATQLYEAINPCLKPGMKQEDFKRQGRLHCWRPNTFIPSGRQIDGDDHRVG